MDGEARPRRRPVQGRAEEKVERILDATARLMESDGLSSLTTNGIAEEAGVNISVLYRYFADKFEVLEALAERTHERVRVSIEEAAKAAAPRTLTEGLELYVQVLRTEIGIRIGSLAPALAQPRLRAVHHRNKERQIALVAGFIPQFLGVPVSKRESKEIARAVTHAVSGVIVECLEENARRRRALLRELSMMLEAYFEKRAQEIRRRTAA